MNVRLLVNDFDKMFQFYDETLNFKVIWGKLGDDYASFQLNEQMTLSIFKSKLMETYLNIDRTENTNKDKFLLAFGCDSVDDLYNTLKSKHVIFLNEPTNKPGWGIRCVHLRDPEGNLIEFYKELPKSEWSEDLKKDLENY